MKKALFLIIPIFVIGCMDKYDNQVLLVVNKTNDSVYSILSYKKFDKIISPDEPGVFYSTILLPNDGSDELKPKTWEGCLKMSNEKKLYAYFIKKDSIDRYGWEKVHSMNLYNKKYTLDIDDLDSLNWTIKYNGN